MAKEYEIVIDEAVNQDLTEENRGFTGLLFQWRNATIKSILKYCQNKIADYDVCRKRKA